MKHNEITSFSYVRDLNGKLLPISLARRNGWPMLLFPPTCIDPPAEEHAGELFEQEKYYVNLNPLERDTWSKILRGWPLSRIAKDDGVSHQAILSRIRGNSKGQGGMVAKNFYVLVWWIAREAQRLDKPK